MPIIKEVLAPNGAAATFHKVVSISFSGDFSLGKLQVASWKDQNSYTGGSLPVWNWYPEISYDAFTGPPLASAEGALVADSGLLSAGTVVSLSAEQSLEGIRARKNAEINASRWIANNTTFTYGGKQIAVDPLSRSDLDGAAMEILNSGGLPASWPGAWKAVDNTYVPIPDLDTWKLFYRAMYEQGLANFVHAQALKTYLNDPARTLEEIDAIHWGMSLT